MAQGNGRDHHIKGFSIWMAGGGIKGGITHGATDEFGYSAVQRRRPRPRPARHDPRPLRHRPHPACLSLPGPRLPPDRRRRQGREADPGVNAERHRRALHPRECRRAAATQDRIAIDLKLDDERTTRKQAEPLPEQGSVKRFGFVSLSVPFVVVRAKKSRPMRTCCSNQSARHRFDRCCVRRDWSWRRRRSSMLSKAARRPARLDRPPRRTRATAPAHSNPSCTGAFFLDFDSFIRQNPHKEKRDPNSRSTLHHSLGPKGTRIPPSTAVLAFGSRRVRQSDRCHSSRSARGGPKQSFSPSRECKQPKPAIRTIAWSRSLIANTKSLCHRTTRRINFDPRHSWRLRRNRRPETGS